VVDAGGRDELGGGPQEVSWILLVQVQDQSVLSLALYTTVR
jgi:hypothetical protein